MPAPTVRLSVNIPPDVETAMRNHLVQRGPESVTKFVVRAILGQIAREQETEQ